MAKVSVIVPVYNARDYVVPCVESLLGQTLDDIEIVFVDDHGTDDSMDVIRRITDAWSDKKQFVFAQTSSNSGPGVARNVGIAAASGEYVAFVDSDDWIELEFCESLYKAASKRNADLAYCGLRMDNMRDGSSVEKSNPRVSSGEFTDKKRKQFLTTFVSYFTTFIYKRSFLADNALRFPDTRSSEDSSFLTCCLLSAGRIASVAKPMYHYVQRMRSLSTKLDPGRYLQRLRSFDEVISYARRHDLYDAYKDEIEFLYVKKAYLMACKTYLDNEKKPDPNVLKELSATLTEKVPGYKDNPYLRRKPKLRLAVRFFSGHTRLAARLGRKSPSGK